MKKLLITGATGFVGKELLHHLRYLGFSITAAVRCYSSSLPVSVRQILFDEVLPDTDWSSVLSDTDVVIHLAARVHVAQDSVPDKLAAFRKINTASTLNLARQSAASGISRFIFLSSIKVNGEFTKLNKPFTVDDSYIPTDPYGLSKYEAEQGLREIGLKTGMELVIIRPPLVYGPGVKANFLNMMIWINKGIPLPFGAIHNQRSLVSLDNLVDLITICIDHPAAAYQTLLVSDGEDLSTTVLLERLGLALGKPARLLPVPQYLLGSSLTLLGKRALAQRLCGSLQVDISKTCHLLNWVPPSSVEEALHKTASTYQSKE